MKVSFDVVVDCCTGEFKELSNISKLRFKQFVTGCRPNESETKRPHRRKLTGNETTVRRPY